MAIYLGMMLLPMILLFTAFCVLNLRTIDRDLKKQGRQTVDAVDVNFDLVLSNVLYQNDLLTSTTRMNLSLKRILTQSEMSYGDAVNIDSLLAILRSIKDSHEYVESIYLYTDGAARYFSSDKGIHTIDESTDSSWLDVYREIPKDSSSYIAPREISLGAEQVIPVLSIYKRLLLQKGCIVVNIDVAKLEEILAKQISGREETVCLVNRDGDILAEQSAGSGENGAGEYIAQMKEQYGEGWQDYLKGLDGVWVRTQTGTCLLSVGSYDEMEVYYVSAISSKARTESIFATLQSFLAFLVLFIFSYLRIMPLQYKLIVLGVVYCFTILMPTLTIFIFRKINGFSPEELVERKRRYIPFILTITSYVFCLLMMHRLNIPWYMTGIILSALVVMIICVIVNLKWKLSEHMAGMGGIVGGLVSFSALFSYNPVWWLCLFILVAGILGSARIILQHHTLGEVLAGFTVGFVCSLLVLHPLSNVLFRIFLF